jgi:ribonucleotide reductase beta subunit family protein with ferritin-like domain
LSNPHFQSKGKNKALNIVRGINFSVRDESMHSEAGGYTYRTQKKEENRSPEEMHSVENRIQQAALAIYEHEERIIDMMWEKGDISGITKEDLKIFVKSRLNICLGNLEISPIFEFEPETNTIETWFYDSINKFVFNDFFSGIGREYVRDWDEESFE